ncbi:YeeE/YedE thiosulfate transporter family protein [Sphingomonas montana]|uniref:YeeE/YedE thiosulfate transporter family protein n=1 Tax=Sphingomonas montana TaxID=1843236 RepID=UPI00096DBD88|nr:YeeE/YedE thiosulfate transporter family protein [Sphingomonas montana]
MTTLLVCVLAFWMGYSVNQGGTCAVATAYEILHHRRSRLFVGLLAASATAGLVAVPLVWFAGGSAMLAGTVGVSGTMLAGAVIFGIGATLNDACLLGALGRLGEGELRLVLLPAGLAAGFLLADGTGIGRTQDIRDSILSAPGATGNAVLAAFAVILAATIAHVSRGRIARPPGQWPFGLAMLVLGATGGTLYATAPAWTYADLVRRSLPLAMSLENDVAALTVTATIAGAVAAARRRKRWRPRGIAIPAVAKTVGGGFFMGLGAAVIPGGNDGLVLAALPALSVGGAVAYVVMLATIMAALAIKHAWQGRRPSADRSRPE